MLQSANSFHCKKVDEPHLWNENPSLQWKIESQSFHKEGDVISSFETKTDVASTPNSQVQSVITSSNLCGVPGATTNSVDASTSQANAHDIGLPKVGAISCPLASSMFCVNSFLSQSDTQKSSISQSTQSFSCEIEGTQDSLMNQNLIGAKRILSETCGSTISSNNSRYTVTDQHIDMQANVHNMDSNSRYNSNDSASSHGIGNFVNGSNTFRSNGLHSGNESARVINQNSSFAAQYNNSNDKAKNQNYGCENNGNIDSPYSGWQGLNTTIATSISSNNGWNIPDNKARSGRSIHGNRENVSNGNTDENMTIDNDATFSGLLGATGGNDNFEEKSNGSNNFAGNSSRSLHLPRMGLLGGGESSLTSQSSGWNGNSSSSSVVSSWVGGNRSNNGTSDIGGNSNSENMMVDNDMGFSGILGATGGADFSENKQSNGNNPYKSDHSILPPRIGLLGGGEGNLNSAPNGWGNPNGSGNSSSWGTNVRTSTNSAVSDMTGASVSGTSPTKPQGSWAQAAGKGLNSTLPSCSNGNGNNMQASNAPAIQESLNTSQDISTGIRERTVEEKQDEEIKRNLMCMTGWGVNEINQDSPWDVGESPPISENMPKEHSTPVWRPQADDGTDLWANNLRMNKGVCSSTPAPTTSAPPWGHTPSSNIGGHWGDDDSSNNMWSGVPHNTNQNPPNWSESNVPANNMWPNTLSNEKQWGANHTASWHEDANNDNGTSVWNASVNKGRPVGNWSPIATPKKEMPPSSGWEPPSPPAARRPPCGNYDDGTAVWGNPQRQGKVSHWKDMPAAKPIMNSANNMVGPNGIPITNVGNMQSTGPGMIRLPNNNKGDAVWNKQSQSRNSSWQDLPPHRDSPTIGNWGEEHHMQNPMKSLANQQNTSYNAGWNEQSNNSLPYWGAKPKANTSNWADGQVDTSSWLGPSKQGGKPLSRDLIWASKQFRVLIELGFKKEDAENALRNNNMNFDDALTELRSGVPLDNNMMDVDNFAGRKMRPATASEDISIPDHNLDPPFATNFHNPNNFQSLNFPGVQAFKQVNKAPNNNANLMNTTLGSQSTIGSIGNFAPALVHKLLQQQQQQQQPVQSFGPNTLPNAFSNQGGRTSQNNFPSAAQLRHLVQQIQMAVQAGHLNPQILNQPLAPQTLQLLYQLLQQIKVLSQLQHQQVYQNQHIPKPLPGVPNTSSGLQLNVQLTQTKQRILNLQNQIAAQQALFLKAQVPQHLQTQQPIHGTQPSGDLFKPNIEGMPALHNEFRDLSIKDVPQQNPQSRLTQWKLPFEKDENQPCHSSDVNQGNLGVSNDFSRAPGTINNNKPATNAPISNSGPGLHPLLGQGDGAWSSLSSRPDSGWPEAVSSSSDNSTTNSLNSTAATMLNNGQSSLDNKEPTQSNSGPVSATSASHASYNLTDLVPEFEPGKPWKGTQLKNIEDDPHITPGSITRSPLSINTIKDSNLFWNSKTSPANTSSEPASSLTSSTWVFNPSTTVSASSSTTPGKTTKSNWGPETSSNSELWGTSITKQRGPSTISGQGWDRQTSSTYLILRNLTPQIDGSTLKTLCMQHGPLQLFHLSLTRGVALVRYQTREEATKAQSALNNCVLGNTTMLADIPSEGEIQQYLQVNSGQSNNAWSSPQSQPNNGTGGSNFHGNTTTTYYGGSSNGSKIEANNWNGNMPASQLWPFSNSSLWSSSQAVSDHDPSTNPMNSYLPGDLLGGEPM